MKKIGDVTSTADKNGEWTNGNVAAGIAPTILEAGWLNSVQREILGVKTLVYRKSFSRKETILISVRLLKCREWVLVVHLPAISM